jgi:hypothetical protein
MLVCDIKQVRYENIFHDVYSDTNLVSFGQKNLLADMQSDLSLLADTEKTEFAERHSVSCQICWQPLRLLK